MQPRHGLFIGFGADFVGYCSVIFEKSFDGCDIIALALGLGRHLPGLLDRQPALSFLFGRWS